MENDRWAVYDQPIDPRGPSSQSRIARLVPDGSQVLELGCSTGRVSTLLSRRGCQVTGIDSDTKALARAAANADVHRLNLNDPEALASVLDGRRFDVIIAADVLEHLNDPSVLLAGLHNYLAQDGVLLVSIPNVAHASVRLALYAGHFDYSADGLLDRTHLHFYTRASAYQLLQDCGFDVTHEEVVTASLFEGVPIPNDSFVETLKSHVIHQPDALTYQFILEAKSTFATGSHSLETAGSLTGMAELKSDWLARSQAAELKAGDERYREIARERDNLRARLDLVLSSRVWRYSRRLRQGKQATSRLLGRRRGIR